MKNYIAELGNADERRTTHAPSSSNKFFLKIVVRKKRSINVQFATNKYNTNNVNRTNVIIVDNKLTSPMKMFYPPNQLEPYRPVIPMKNCEKLAK